jgi:hypothetical protein
MATGIEIERQRAQRYPAEAEQCRADAAKTIDLMIRPCGRIGSGMPSLFRDLHRGPRVIAFHVREQLSLTRGASNYNMEKGDLYAGTAARFYRLNPLG